MILIWEKGQIVLKLEASKVLASNVGTLFLQSAVIPAIYKQATIIVIPKAGKPTDNSSAYRLVSLLCPVAKLLERPILTLFSVALPVVAH